MTIKTFRGLLADDGQDKIRVAGGKLEDGYRIVKFQLMPVLAGATNYEHVVQIWKDKQKVLTSTINFTENTLLAAAYLEGGADYTYTDKLSVVFDKEIFNQDIYITHVDEAVGEKVNYYLELEQVKMSGPEAAAVNFRAALTHGGA